LENFQLYRIIFAYINGKGTSKNRRFLLFDFVRAGRVAAKMQAAVHMKVHCCKERR